MALANRRAVGEAGTWSTREPAVLFCVYLAYLGALDAAAADAGLAFRFVHETRGIVLALAWLAARLVTLGAVAFLLASSRRAVAVGTFVVATSVVVVDLAVRGINDVGTTQTTVRLALEEGAYGGAALRVFGTTGIVWALLGLGLMHVLWILVHDVLPFRARRAWPSALVLVVSIALSLVLPAPTWTPVFVLLPFAAADVALHAVPVAARSAAAPPAHRPLAPHLVLIVDESVRGDLLSLARPETRTTPWLDAHRAELADFGIASSTANCSAASNAALLTGLGPGDLPDERGLLRRRPTLFDAARRAGLRTVLVDAQAPRATRTLALSAGDLQALSRLRVVKEEAPALAPFELDGALADIVVAETNGAPSFVYAIKRGAHYPYRDALPTRARRRTKADAVALGFPDVEADEAALYLDALEYTVDGFLSNLLTRLRDEDVVVVYTSDHGESLLEDGHSRTHCAEGLVPPEQGRVPLLVWASPRAAGRTAALFAQASAGHDRVSAYRVHPTLLEGFGYDPSARGASLFSGGADSLRFFSGDVLGRTATWWNPIR